MHLHLGLELVPRTEQRSESGADSLLLALSTIFDAVLWLNCAYFLEPRHFSSDTLF